MAKWLAIVGGVVALLIAIPLLYVDSLAKSALEEGATETFGTRTTLGSVSLGLLSGKVGLGKLRVRNPEGWKEKHFFEIGHGRFAVGIRQFMEDVVEVPELVIDDVHLSLERTPTRSNYGAILSHMEKAPPPPPGAEPKRFVIREVRITNVKADLHLEAVGGGVGKELEVLIPEIRLRNVGTGSQGGVLVSQMWSTVMRAVLSAVVREGGGVAGFITRDLGGSLARLGNVPVEVLGNVTRTGVGVATGVGQKAGETLGEAAGGGLGGAEDLGKAAGGAVKKGLGGLLDRKD